MPILHDGSNSSVDHSRPPIYDDVEYDFKENQSLHYDSCPFNPDEITKQQERGKDLAGEDNGGNRDR